MQFAKSHFLASGLGFLSGLLGAALVLMVYTPGEDRLRQEFYDIENAVHVSPHSVRKHIAGGDEDFVLVDLRSQEEYEREHIVGAVSIPAYSDPDTSAYGDVERIVVAFRELRKENPEKDLIVYCYSIPCMTGRKVGQLLANHSIYVKHLGIGWNEWRYFWTLWNHEHEWKETDVLEYIASGPNPGVFQGEVTISPCIEGQFGC